MEEPSDDELEPIACWISCLMAPSTGSACESDESEFGTAASEVVELELLARSNEGSD